MPHPTRRKNKCNNLGRKHLELSERRRVFARIKRRGKRAERKSASKKYKAARARSRLEELTFGTFNFRTAAVNGVNGIDHIDTLLRTCAAKGCDVIGSQETKRDRTSEISASGFRYARTRREGPRREKPKASGLVLVRSPFLTINSHKWRELVFSGRLICRCHDVFLWCYVCFVLLRCSSLFVEAAALRPTVYRYTGTPIGTRVSFFFLFLFGDVAFSEYFFFHFRFLFVWRVRRSTFFPSEWCFSIF